jgi:hypothetical protein
MSKPREQTTQILHSFTSAKREEKTRAQLTHSSVPMHCGKFRPAKEEEKKKTSERQNGNISSNQSIVQSTKCY